MRKHSLMAGTAVAGLIAMNSMANAADVYRAPAVVSPTIVAPAPSWTGCYIGVHGGWGWGNSRATGTSSGWLSNNIDVSGGLFGGQVGCDHQLASGLVVGIRGAFAGADLNGSGLDEYYGTSTSGPDTVKIDSLGSITGRIGWTGANRSHMIYVQGGWAFGHNQLVYVPCTYDCSYSTSQSRSGWTVGVGGEQLLSFWPGASVFAEANWYDFGSKDYDTGSYISSVKQTFGTAIVGVNFRFGHH